MEQEDFQRVVLKELYEIKARLDNIDSRFNEATAFASDLVENNPVMNSPSMDALRGVFESFSSSSMDKDGTQLAGLLDSLKEMKSRLSSIKEVVEAAGNPGTSGN